MTLVVDASVVAEVLLGTARGAAAAERLGRDVLVAPSHLTVEVASVVRGWALAGSIDEDAALRAFREYEELDVERIDVIALLPDAFGLRHNLTAYDALYVVLARALGCRLLTLDARLASVASDCAVLPT